MAKKRKKIHLTSKNVLLISPEPWEHIFVSKHHYATHLANLGNKVFFLNPPLQENSCIPTDYSNVFSVHYNGFIKGLRFMPAMLRWFFIRQKFESLQKLCGVTFDIVWSFDNSVFFDFLALPDHVYKISHIVDLNQDFEFKRSTTTAHLCLASSKFILNKQKKLNFNSHNIGHGYKHVTEQKKPFELSKIHTINCGYAGNLDIRYIDWALVEVLLDKFHTVGFHFAGQWNKKAEFTHIFKKPNFHYYGKLETNALPSFYQQMNSLILVYQYEKHPEQLANPHKMLEYLASGKMVVGTWTSEYEQLAEEGSIKMAKNSDEFISTFEVVKNNLDEWNNKNRVKSRIDFATQNTYENQIERIEKLINS